MGIGGVVGVGCLGVVLEVIVSWVYVVFKIEVFRYRRNRLLSREGSRRGVRTLGLVLVLSGYIG